MKSSKCLCFFIVACCLANTATAGELEVSGAISHDAGQGECMVQLLRPGTEKIAEEVVSRDFVVRLKYAQGEGPYLVNMTCGGYRVYTSPHPLDLNRANESFVTGEIDARERLDSDDCRELSGAEAIAALRPMIAAFEKQGAPPLNKVHVGTPNLCPEETYVIVRAIDEYSGPGMHWIISTTKRDGHVSIEQGL
jgi:hypothetical protein